MKRSLSLLFLTTLSIIVTGCTVTNSEKNLYKAPIYMEQNRAR